MSAQLTAYAKCFGMNISMSFVLLLKRLETCTQLEQFKHW